MRVIRFVVGGFAAFIVGTVAVVAAIGTAITALSGSWWAAPWLAATLVSTAALVWVVRRLWVITPRPPREVPAIRKAIAALPAEAQPSRSRAAIPGVATRLGWTVYGIGVVLAMIVALGGRTEAESELFGLAVIGPAGVAAGILLAIGRDSRGRQNRLRHVLGPPAGLAIVALIQSDSSRGFDERVVFSGVVLLVAGLPLVGGFLLARGIAAYYRATRPVDLTRPLTADGPQVELDRATKHGQSASLVREYSADAEGRALFADDRTLLDGMGYELSTSGEGYDRWREVHTIQALFVRKGLTDVPAKGGTIRD